MELGSLTRFSEANGFSFAGQEPDVLAFDIGFPAGFDFFFEAVDMES